MNCPCCADWRDIALEPVAGAPLFVCPGCRGECGCEPCAIVAGIYPVRDANPDGEHYWFQLPDGRLVDELPVSA